MPPSSPKPSSPIPTGRNRARTLDHYPRHHPPSARQLFLDGPRFYPLQSHVDSVPLVPDPSEPLPESSSRGNNTKDPLQTIDSMRLQVVRDKDGNTLGLKVIDINNTYGKEANVSAPLPLARTNTGLVFSVKTREAIDAVYSRAAHITGSERIMGIMFAPPNEPGFIQDADWSFLGTPDAKTEKEDPAETGNDSTEAAEAKTQPVDISEWLKDVKLVKDVKLDN
ncbi:hypothetical protein DER45DRAFT_536163 [Fusarium avenaceum]|nr:hypothetical protein DER45DRAFT_536163 [Fusarium avenaceum]